MKNKLKKNIALVMASVMITGAVATVMPTFNSNLVYASTYSHENSIISQFPPAGYELFIAYMNFHDDGYWTLTDTQNNKSTLMTISGEIVMPALYDRINEISDDGTFLIYDNFLASDNNNYFFINSNGEKLFTETYDSARAFYEGLATVKKGSKWGVIDTNGNIVVDFKYDNINSFSNGFASFMENNLYGVIDKNGNVIVQPTYGNPMKFVGNIALVYNKSYNKYGIIDNTGKEVVPCAYNSIGVVYNPNSLHNSTLSSLSENAVKHGLIPVSNANGLYGFVDTNGNKVVDLIYDKVGDFSDGLAIVQKGNSYGFIDVNGNEVVNLIYDNVYNFSNGLAAVKKGELWGYVDVNGTEVVPCQYKQVNNFSEGLGAVKNSADLCGFIDVNGNEVVPHIYLYVAPFFEDGTSAVKNSDDLWGLIDKNGTEIIPCIYNSIGNFNKDVVYVKKDEIDYVIKKPSVETTTTTPIPTETTTTTTVSQTNSTVLINGQKIDFQAYNIDGSNYFKLRDIAQALKGTEKQFEVSWNSDKKAMELTSTTAYTTIGGELENSGTTPNSVKVTSSSMFVNGTSINLQAYNIDDNNYFKLRDLGKLFNFGIGWDGTSKVVTVNTSENYTD